MLTFSKNKILHWSRWRKGTRTHSQKCKHTNIHIYRRTQPTTTQRWAIAYLTQKGDKPKPCIICPVKCLKEVKVCPLNSLGLKILRKYSTFRGKAQDHRRITKINIFNTVTLIKVRQFVTSPSKKKTIQLLTTFNNVHFSNYLLAFF